jgi:hypothetical protein
VSRQNYEEEEKPVKLLDKNRTHHAPLRQNAEENKARERHSILFFSFWTSDRIVAVVRNTQENCFPDASQ